MISGSPCPSGIPSLGQQLPCLLGIEGESLRWLITAQLRDDGWREHGRRGPGTLVDLGVAVTVEGQSEGAAHPHVVEWWLPEVHGQRADRRLRLVETNQLGAERGIFLDLGQERQGNVRGGRVLVPIEIERGARRVRTVEDRPDDARQRWRERVVVVGVRFHHEPCIPLVLGELPRSRTRPVEDEVFVPRDFEHRGIDDRPDERGQERREVGGRLLQLDDDGAIVLGGEAKLGPLLARDPGIEAADRFHEGDHRREIGRIERPVPGCDEMIGDDRVAAGVGGALTNRQGVAQTVLRAHDLLRQVERDPPQLVVSQEPAPDVGIHHPESAVVGGAVRVERDRLPVRVEGHRDLGPFHDRCVLPQRAWRASRCGRDDALVRGRHGARRDRRPAQDVPPGRARIACAQRAPESMQVTPL